jgi:steroid 5-alpha reductase family enzyme
MITILGINLGAILCFMMIAWVLSLILKDASIVDIFWGLGFVLVAWITFLLAEGYWGRRLLLTGLVTLWGVRLALHIGVRNHGKGEDPRYQAWRKQHGKDFWWVSLFKIFILQGFLLWVISLAVQAGQWSSKPDQLTWLGFCGLLIWAVGFVFESVGDRQLSRFKADPGNKGKVMDRGLWHYTRHPNYFGESLMWWGLFFIALENINNLWTIISPITITFLLLKVSGVVLLEKTIVKRRPKYEDYIKGTSAFIPWFPKRIASKNSESG